ncbi:hypothetical protein ACFFRR_008336 [Megaselia abdita]
MKLVIFTVLIFSLSLVFSAKLGKNEEVNVVRSEQSIQSDSYKFSYELDNGVKAEESGHLNEDEEFLIHGSFEYTSPEGDKIALQYTADKNGFQPQGAHLPTPPPIPEIILRAVEYLTSH